VREIRAPRGASAGPVLGLAIALVLFVGLLAYETQHLAMFARYPAWFGKPLFAHIYNPFAVLWWIQKIDPTAFIVLPMQHFRPVNPAVHRLVLGILDHLSGAAVPRLSSASSQDSHSTGRSAARAFTDARTSRRRARSRDPRCVKPRPASYSARRSAASCSSTAARRTCSSWGRLASAKRTAPR